jgi:membrane-associated phospholipid phosphatase
MKALFHKFPRHFIACFSGWNLIFNILAIVLTYVIVMSGTDWQYYSYFQTFKLMPLLFPAILAGGLLPILAPLTLLAFGKIRQSAVLINTAWALGQAAIMGSLISSLYKAVTGRAHPTPFESLSSDITHTFNFGILKGGIFWGWPSSHTTIAFAMALTLIMLFPKNKILRIPALLYALYVGIGVSVSIHWFSDFIAGAIIGAIIGMVIGRGFYKKLYSK